MSEDTQTVGIGGAVVREDSSVFPEWLPADTVSRGTIFPVAHPMNQGVDGECALVEGKHGECLFLKVMTADQKRWLRFENSVGMAQRAGQKGISPRLIASDAAKQAFLFGCLDENWRPAIVADLRADDVRSRIIAATRRLHQLPPLAHGASVFERISELRQDMETGARHVISGNQNQVAPPEHYREICAVVNGISLGFAAADNDLAPCHVENSLSNFMLGPSGAVQIVDFDRAANGDPLSDVGALCNEYCRTDQDIAQAVEIYSGQCDVATTARVKLHMILSAFYWGMWGRVSQSSSCRPDIEYFKYGENQFIRCAGLISNWDVKQLIREM